MFGGSTAQVVPSLEAEATVFTNLSSIADTKLGDLWAFNTSSGTWSEVTQTIAEQARDTTGHIATLPVARSHHVFVKGRGMLEWFLIQKSRRLHLS